MNTKPNPTPAAMRSRHTPDLWETGSSAIITNCLTGSFIADCGKTAGPEEIALAEGIVAKHNALAGMNPEAVRDVVDMLESCVDALTHDGPCQCCHGSNEGGHDGNCRVIKSRAALAALKANLF